MKLNSWLKLVLELELSPQGVLFDDVIKTGN